MRQRGRVNEKSPSKESENFLCCRGDDKQWGYDNRNQTGRPCGQIEPVRFVLLKGISIDGGQSQQSN